MIPYVRHLKLVHQLLFDSLDHLGATSGDEEIIHVEGDDDDHVVVVVDVHVGVRLERDKSDFDQARIDGPPSSGGVKLARTGSFPALSRIELLPCPWSQNQVPSQLTHPPLCPRIGK